jgi:hypothetical protein
MCVGIVTSSPTPVYWARPTAKPRFCTSDNHGVVYDKGVLITLAIQSAGDHRGSHRHYQKRPVVKTAQLDSRQVLATQFGPYRDPEGFYYRVYDYDNGSCLITINIHPFH